jgi:hypothetical protein
MIWYGMPRSPIKSAPLGKLHFRNAALSFVALSPPQRLSKPVIPPDPSWRIRMQSMILAALTVLSLGVGVANAQSFAHEMPPAPHQASQQ